MGCQQSKVNSGSSNNNNNNKDTKTEPSASTSAVSYYSKKCINIHTYMGTSPPVSSKQSNTKEPSPPLLHYSSNPNHHPKTLHTNHQPQAQQMSSNTTTTNSPAATTGTTIYELRKRRPGCTGMFWREDPRPNKGLSKGGRISNANWPRDGAQMTGEVIKLPKNGERWLIVDQIKQYNQTEWKDAPENVAMPFEYNNHYYLAEFDPKTDGTK